MTDWTDEARETIAELLEERDGYGPGFPCEVNLSADRADAIRAALGEIERRGAKLAQAANARVNWEAALAEVDRLTAEVERLRGLIVDWHAGWAGVHKGAFWNALEDEARGIAALRGGEK